MESRRFITKASTSQIQIDLPDSMVNRKIEILVIALEEATDKKKQEKDARRLSWPVR